VTVLVDRVLLDPQFGSNCYLVRAAESAAEAAVIDPGGDPTPLLAELERLGAGTGGILVTHTDIDHIEGVAELAEKTGAEVWAPAGEADALRRGETRSGRVVRAHPPEHEVGGGDSISVAGIAFEVVAVPGHSIDHVAFCVDGQLFSGDLLFAGSVGRTDFPGGDWATLVDSIRRLIDRFGPDATVYPGHGERTTLGRELETNPFLGELRAGR
jgi:hydroxyacylglutathione hydrolase